MFQLCFNFNRIHDCVGKALRTANQDHVTAMSHALSASFHPGFILSWMRGKCFETLELDSIKHRRFSLGTQVSSCSRTGLRRDGTYWTSRQKKGSGNKVRFGLVCSLLKNTVLKQFLRWITAPSERLSPVVLKEEICILSLSDCKWIECFSGWHFNWSLWSNFVVEVERRNCENACKHLYFCLATIYVLVCGNTMYNCRV